MHSRAFPLALLTLALTAPVAAAQYTGESGQPQGGRHGRMHGPGRGTPVDPVVLKGPPAPADFQKLVELPQDKVAGYRNLYDRLMAETKPQRDSLASLRGGMGGSADSSDRESFQQRRAIFMPLNEELTRRQAAFDDALKDMLDKDQWKRYQKWRDQERKVAEQQRQDRWRRHRGAVPPADSQPPA